MFVTTTAVSGRQPSNGPAGQPLHDAQPSATTPPTAIAVNLGSARTQVWAAGRGSLNCPTVETVGTSSSPVRRGRVAYGAGCIGVLSRLIRQYRDPIPAGSVVVVCRPVLATMAEQ